MPERAPISPELGSATAVLEGIEARHHRLVRRTQDRSHTANLHSAVAAGVRGPVIADLTIPKATGGMITGSVDLTPSNSQACITAGST